MVSQLRIDARHTGTYPIPSHPLFMEGYFIYKGWASPYPYRMMPRILTDIILLYLDLDNRVNEYQNKKLNKLSKGKE